MSMWFEQKSCQMTNVVKKLWQKKKTRWENIRVDYNITKQYAELCNENEANENKRMESSFFWNTGNGSFSAIQLYYVFECILHSIHGYFFPLPNAHVFIRFSFHSVLSAEETILRWLAWSENLKICENARKTNELRNNFQKQKERIRGKKGKIQQHVSLTNTIILVPNDANKRLYELKQVQKTLTRKSKRNATKMKWNSFIFFAASVPLFPHSWYNSKSFIFFWQKYNKILVPIRGYDHFLICRYKEKHLLVMAN